MSLVFYIAAIVVFVLAGLGVTLGDAVTSQELVAFGLASFVLGHVLGDGFPWVVKKG